MKFVSHTEFEIYKFVLVAFVYIMKSWAVGYSTQSGYLASLGKRYKVVDS